MESTTYTVAGKEFELQHHGVKGMRWGKRKARPEPVGGGQRGGKASTDSPEALAAAKEARRQKAKRAVAIGAAVVGTALAAYGAKKLHDVVRDKNYEYRMNQGKRTIDNYIKSTSTLYRSGNNFDWRASLAQDARDQKYMEQIIRGASRRAEIDSFGTAVRNVVTDYLDRNRR